MKYLMIGILLAPLISPTFASDEAAPLSAASSVAGIQANPYHFANEPSPAPPHTGSTYTYLRCWYQISDSPLHPRATYEWAKDPVSGDWYRVHGSWWKSGAFHWENMFYSDTTQDTLKSVCEQTLARKGIQRPVISALAADHAISFNYTIWTNDTAAQGPGFNKVIAFGDSLSDTQNMYNASQWKLPGHSWLGGRFSNGLVWVEYLARSLNLPLYNWAIGGAGTDKYLVVPGLEQEITSWKEYMRKAPDYQPEHTLFTMWIGANDLLNYGRTPDQAISAMRRALISLLDGGAKYVVLLNLPALQKAPVFKLKTGGEQAAQQVQSFNTKLTSLVDEMRTRYGGTKQLTLFDASQIFDDMLQHPAQYGMTNTTESCLNIRSLSSTVYLEKHEPRSTCTDPGQYVFWDTLHPTTATHRQLAAHVETFIRNQYSSMLR
ncbi:thermolabile hemolysin [Chitinivorax tropicus]|uniref:Thermolabile hemolysin n=1 Tax=Chitinivorax tropicus TaxID=714531 RepID=A0A840MRI7_9PROT|nr:SGNH/GDSL hydrolase family protein [Chitinivorax tropicus]MBB5017831.1 thermolabile hemolysin [Chitinivorax tropicus]